MYAVYILAVWIHIVTVTVWIGSMFFGDPKSDRFFSRLFERKLKGVGWYAQAVLWATGLFMLHYRGIQPPMLFSGEFVTSSWGLVMWLKIALVLALLMLQITVGNKPSKLIYGYVLVAFTVVGLSVVLVRPGVI